MKDTNRLNNCDYLKKLKFKQYLKSLKKLIPDCVQNDKLVINEETILISAGLVQEIAAMMYDTFYSMCDSDFCEEMMSVAEDIFVLGKFLDISLETLLIERECGEEDA